MTSSVPDEVQQAVDGPLFRSVAIPACDGHDGWAKVTVTLLWECRVCGGPRGEVTPAVSYDGSRRLHCDGWTNPCGHVDRYSSLRREAGLAS